MTSPQNDARPIAIMSIGDAAFAFPSELVREVLAWPTMLAPAVSRSAHVLGYFPIRSESLPLYDLPSALNITSKVDDSRRMVAVLDLGVGRVGVAIDSARGFGVLPTENVAALGAAPARDGAPGGGASPKAFTDASGEVILFFDEEALLALEGLSLASAATSANEASANAAAADAQTPNADAAAPGQAGAASPTGAAKATGELQLLCFDWRDVSLAVDIQYVREIVTAPPFEPLRLMSDVFLGKAEIRGEDIAVVDTDVLLGRPKKGDQAPRLVLQLDCNGRRLGAPASSIHRLVRGADLQSSDFPSRASPHDLVSATFQRDDGRRVLVLNAIALAEQQHVSALVDKLNGASAQSQRSQSSKLGRLSSYIKMQAGGAVYADLRNLVQLIEMPRASMMLKEANDQLRGFITHRDEVIPVLDLAEHLGAGREGDGPSDEPLRIALAQGQGRAFGMIVSSFESIEHLSINAEKQHLQHQARAQQVSGVCRPAVSYLTAHHRGGATTIRFLDLETLSGGIADIIASTVTSSPPDPAAFAELA